MPPKISVICPNFNKADYISKCIYSVINQTFKDWELIIVDDASTDKSLLMVNRIIKKYPYSRIKVISQEQNAGVDQARFTGIAHSTGAYLFFVDSDDWIPSNALSLLYEKIEEEHSDIAYGSFVRVIDPYSLIKSSPKNNYSKNLLSEPIGQPLLFDDYFISYFGDNKLLVSMCGKLYKRSVVLKANLKPSFYKMGEDLVFNLFLHPHLQKISFVTETVYYYRFGGMTNTSNPHFLANIKAQYFLKKELIEKFNYMKAIPFYKYELINCFYSHFQNLVLLDKVSYESLQKLIEKEIKDPVYDEAPFDTSDDNKTNMIKTKNIAGIMEIIKNQVKANRTKHFINKNLNVIFKGIS